MPGKLKKRAGMTLVEVLVAIAILSVIAAPILGMFVSGTRITTVSYRLTSAAVTAQMRMEEFVGLDEEGLAGEIGETRDYNGFRVGAVITADAVGGFSHLKEVTVTVFDDSGGTLYSLTNIINTAPAGMHVPESSV